jgi:hypothetical protein
MIIKMGCKSRMNRAKSNTTKVTVKETKEDTKKVISSKSTKNDDEPSRARNAYNFFTIDVSKELSGEKFERGGLLKEVASRWKKLTPKEKEKYDDMAEEDKKKFGNGKLSKAKGSKRAVSKHDTKKGKRIIDDEEEEEIKEDKK